MDRSPLDEPLIVDLVTQKMRTIDPWWWPIGDHDAYMNMVVHNAILDAILLATSPAFLKTWAAEVESDDRIESWPRPPSETHRLRWWRKRQ